MIMLDEYSNEWLGYLADSPCVVCQRPLPITTIAEPGQEPLIPEMADEHGPSHYDEGA